MTTLKETVNNQAVLLGVQLASLFMEDLSQGAQDDCEFMHRAMGAAASMAAVVYNAVKAEGGAELADRWMALFVDRTRTFLGAQYGKDTSEVIIRTG